MRLRVRDSLTVAFKHVGKKANITCQQIESEEYINGCIENNLDFLRAIPNTTWYWSEWKRDLFSMIRQLGKSTVFLTMSANEIGWTGLMQLLYKFKNEGRELSKKAAAQLINILINILESKKNSPFGQYRAIQYFKRIEFHRGSHHVHILLWFENTPQDPIGADKQDAIALINQLISVSSSEASGNIKLQTHKHTFTCYKKITARRQQKCRFDVPFMACRSTVILSPMPKQDPNFAKYSRCYKSIMIDLENNDYSDMETFYEANLVRIPEYTSSRYYAFKSLPKTRTE
ncbi:ATP-dependent DNA helicase [Trichonephila inaurata madagascariensis]|uniref:ATP-dependent DNA helicase n=1 Tax=Trichonephila inaurata madagascariensis TaxID=2747483 RepID=A0A8X7C8P3_9ARAC|nr:ATP-dependent DNA helicase [Trichonephila inaurata madagascariensis]